MKKAVFIVSTVALAIFFVNLPMVFSDAPLILNGGFEIANIGGWTRWCIIPKTTSKIKHSGNYSVKVELLKEYNEGALIQEITKGFSVATSLYATAWVKTENLSAEAYLKVEFFNNGELIGSLESVKVTGTTPWTKLNISTLSVPTDTTMIKLLLMLRNIKGPGGTIGAAYFDDISVKSGSALY